MSGALQGVLSVLGRLFLVTIFFMSAVGNKIPEFQGTAAVMKTVGVPLPEVALVLAILFLVAGSVSLLVGYKARLGAGLLIVFLVLATYYFHAFWRETDPEMQKNQMIQFMKNLSMLGAMLFVVANGSGAWSLEGTRQQAK